MGTNPATTQLFDTSMTLLGSAGRLPEASKNDFFGESQMISKEMKKHLQDALESARSSTRPLAARPPPARQPPPGRPPPANRPPGQFKIYFKIFEII